MWKILTYHTHMCHSILKSASVDLQLKKEMTHNKQTIEDDVLSFFKHNCRIYPISFYYNYLSLSLNTYTKT